MKMSKSYLTFYRMSLSARGGLKVVYALHRSMVLLVVHKGLHREDDRAL
jgi:hypothetical protein